MKYVTRSLKGTYGYIRKQRNFEIIKTLILYAMAFGIFLIGYITLGTKKSLWSVFAVLALLPACKSLVGVIMFARFSSLSSDVYDRLRAGAGTIPALYENILTTNEKTYYIPFICCAAGSLMVLSKEYKDDEKKLREHLTDVLNKAGHKAVVKLFFDEDDMFARLLEINAKYADEENAAGERILNTIKAVSL